MIKNQLKNHVLEIMIEISLLILLYWWAIIKSNGYASWGALFIIPAIFIIPFILAIPIVIVEIIKKDPMKYWQILIVKAAMYIFGVVILYFLSI